MPQTTPESVIESNDKGSSKIKCSWFRKGVDLSSDAPPIGFQKLQSQAKRLGLEWADTLHLGFVGLKS